MKFKIEKRNKLNIGFGNVLESLLKLRGVENVDRFLNLNDEVIEDLNNYDNIEVAGYIFLDHLQKDNSIAIIVDNDGDGFSSAALLYNYIKTIKPECKLDYLIHSGKAHGLTDEMMENIKKSNYDLLFIPDAGSGNIQQHKTLKEELDLDIIVLDHHQCERYSPYACVVNNQMSTNIKNKSITGVGVTYKFCKCVDTLLNVNVADTFLDLLAYGMVSDSADLRDLESRHLVLKGLSKIQDGTNSNELLKKLFTSKSYSMNNKCTISGMAFYMCPAINCIIRGGDLEIKTILFKAFIGSDEKFKDKIRGKGEVELSVEDYILRIYTKLKKIQDKTADEGVELMKQQIEEFNLNKNEIIVVNGTCIEDKTYNRLIVNRLSSSYNKHILLLSETYNTLSGSGTGAKNKEISDFRKWCELTGLFNYCEGHPSAFGCQIPMYNINRLYDLISTIPSSDILVYNVDEIFTEKSLNKATVSLIGSYDYIWGNKLDEPIFAIEDIIVDYNNIKLIGKNKNTIKIIHNGIEFIKFKSSEDEYNNIMKNKHNIFTIVGKFKVNEYCGNTTPQVLIEDYKYKATEVKPKFIF